MRDLLDTPAARKGDAQIVATAAEVLAGRNHTSHGWFTRLLPFLGPAFIASVAYVDPGNFATNIQGGAQFGYTLLWVIVASNLMAMLIQALATKLGIATGQNLAEHCRNHFPRPVVLGMWALMELVAMATDLAQTLRASVTLIHVIEHHAPQTIHGEHHLTALAEARAYLDEVAGRAFPPGWPVERHVHSSEVSDVARSLVAHVGELSPDLIVMCTHGQGGLRHRLFGSIAQQVNALGTTPLLLIRPPLDGTPHPFACRQLLAPLDGERDHEQGLSLAASLAQACRATLHLVMVVPTLHTLEGEHAATATLLPGATSVLLDMTEQGAVEYLSGHATRLRAAGLSVLAEVDRGDPVTTIIHTARRVEADLIVLGTHGEAGMEAFWSGSVAPKIAGRSHIPLLLVPVEN